MGNRGWEAAGSWTEWGKISHNLHNILQIEKAPGWSHKGFQGWEKNVWEQEVQTSLPPPPPPATRPAPPFTPPPPPPPPLSPPHTLQF